MKTISISVPDKEYEFLLKLLKNLDFVKVKDESMSIPEKHKQIVRERVKSSKKEDFTAWTSVRKNLKSRL